MDINCPSCDTEFEAEIWEDGKCPCCNRSFTFDERCYDDENGDYDCWVEIEWYSEEQ